MAIQFLLVTFPEQRSVLADGAAVGVTNHMLMLPADEYQISLDGGGYSPDSQDVALDGTSMVRPLVIAFIPAAMAPAVATRGATVTRGARPATAPSGAPAPVSRAKKEAKARSAGKTPAKKPAKKPGARASRSAAKEKPDA